MIKKDDKKVKLQKENAVAEFQQIVDAFGFNVSMESTKRIVNMDLNGVAASIEQEIVDSASFVEKIMKGLISFDEAKTEIVYKLKKDIKTAEGQVITKEFRFREFTRTKQIDSGIKLNKCNFSVLEDEDQTKLLMSLTEISDDDIFGQLTSTQFNDLRMIGSLFFN